MAFSTAMLASEAFALIRNYMPQYKAQAQNALSVMSSGPINTDFVFRMLDQFNAIISNLNTWKAVVGLNTYATGQGYPTTMTTDCTAVVTAAQGCIDWVVANFPTSGGYLQDEILNADGTRTPRSFTSVQTAGLQTAMTSFIATIG